ncbi:MAG: hypothetical protein M3Y33_09600 [Actinomycetota bacterium]|nr:hypothetical protein [Actinomycetota bacterium]
MAFTMARAPRCREQMAACKYPRIIEFRSERPKDTRGKVLKDELIGS